MAMVTFDIPREIYAHKHACRQQGHCKKKSLNN